MLRRRCVYHSLVAWLSLHLTSRLFVIIYAKLRHLEHFDGWWAVMLFRKHGWMQSAAVVLMEELEESWWLSATLADRVVQTGLGAHESVCFWQLWAGVPSHYRFRDSLRLFARAAAWFTCHMDDGARILVISSTVCRCHAIRIKHVWFIRGFKDRRFWLLQFWCQHYVRLWLLRHPWLQILIPNEICRLISMPLLFCHLCS